MFSKKGEATLEIYKELKILKEANDKRAKQLPPASQWTSEPLEVVLESTGLSKTLPSKLFVGSVLRQEELDLLAQLAPVKCIALACANKVRHERARARGRAIEKHADDSWLIELDAHRAGEWPNYETNDISTLLANADLTITADNDTTPEQITNEIAAYLLATK
jgi:hypothetical protein